MLNAMYCWHCRSVLWSRHRHDFVTCRCGDVSVDGGNDYCKVSLRPGSQTSNLGKHLSPDMGLEAVIRAYLELEAKYLHVCDTLHPG